MVARIAPTKLGRKQTREIFREFFIGGLYLADMVARIYAGEGETARRSLTT